MSIEYTLDIQLTELGFPDLLQSQEASTRETPRHSSSNESLSPTTRTRAQKRKLLDAEKASAAKKSSVLSAPSQSETQPPPQPQPPLLLLLPPPQPPNAKHLSPAQKSLQNKQKQACKDTEVSQPGGDDPTAGPQTTDDPQQNPEEKRDGQNDEGAAEDLDDDSDDSEVSNVYEEEEIDEEDDYEEKDDPDNESSHSGEYRCSVCDLLFTSKFKLQDHMNLHTGARPYCCAECGKRFCQIYNYRVHLRTHAQVKLHRLQCRICLMCFVSDEDLKEHLGRIHTEDKFYECDLCKRVFACLKACESHVQLHKCMLEAVCETCGRNFSSSKSLARHRRKCHRSLKCTDCTKTFTKKNALLKHSFSHLGLLPYTCIRCRCHFRLAKLYRQHKCEPERIHCVACLREFLSQEDFQQHKKDTGCWGNQQPEGDEIRCLECGERFDSKEELKKHAGAHQRILKCAECGKGFRSALLLMSHMGGHAGKSPCLCQSCGLGFPHQQNYDSHLKTCGQTPQPASTSKKRSTSKSSSSEAKKLSTKPGSSNPTTKVPTASTSSTSSTSSASTTSSTTSTISTTTKTATKNPTATTTMLPTATTKTLLTATTKTLPAAPPPPVSVSPGLVPDVSGSGSSDGLWKLTLNKQPPPGVKLVLFLPVGPTQADGLPLPPALPQMLPVPAATVQVQHPIASNRHLGGVGAAALGLPLHTPLDLVTGITPDPGNEEPLDLSRGTVGAHLCKIKEEPQEFEIKREANGADGKVKCEDTEVKPLKMDPMDPSSLSSSSLLITNVKSLGSDAELKSFELTHCKPEKEIKMEVDVSQPEIKRE